jgi:hypothetical protein
MATIVILEHALQRGVRLPYMMYGVAERWRAEGHRVVVHHGLDDPPAGDLAILHVDLTVIPEAYRALCARYPKVINRAVLDISKRCFSRNLLERGSDWTGPVIVKTDTNFGGRPEALLRGVAARAGLAADIPAGPVMDAYPIYDSAGEVPEAMWQTPGLVVERFVPERDERGHFFVRVWSFLGDRELSSRWRGAEPIVKAHNMLEREQVPVPDEVRFWREQLRFDFGKFDYVRREEGYVLLDVNRTPAFPERPDPKAAAMLARLAEGLRLYLR